jgi:hypothetical protein
MFCEPCNGYCSNSEKYFPNAIQIVDWYHLTPIADALLEPTPHKSMNADPDTHRIAGRTHSRRDPIPSQSINYASARPFIEKAVIYITITTKNAWTMPPCPYS